MDKISRGFDSSLPARSGGLYVGGGAGGRAGHLWKCGIVSALFFQTCGGVVPMTRLHCTGSLCAPFDNTLLQV